MGLQEPWSMQGASAAQLVVCGSTVAFLLGLLRSWRPNYNEVSGSMHGPRAQARPSSFASARQHRLLHGVLHWRPSACQPLRASLVAQASTLFSRILSKTIG